MPRPYLGLIELNSPLKWAYLSLIKLNSGFQATQKGPNARHLTDFWGIFFANMGGGGCRNCFHSRRLSRDTFGSQGTTKKAWTSKHFSVAPYCASHRETTSAIPPSLRTIIIIVWGFWCLNMANWVRYPLPFF